MNASKEVEAAKAVRAVRASMWRAFDNSEVVVATEGKVSLGGKVNGRAIGDR